MREVIGTDTHFKGFPPLGSMQFVLKRGMGRAALRPEGLKWIWVGKPVRNMMGCGCKCAYPVLLDYVPEPWKTAAEEVLQKRGHAVGYQCACSGEIIE